MSTIKNLYDLAQMQSQQSISASLDARLYQLLVQSSQFMPGQTLEIPHKQQLIGIDMGVYPSGSPSDHFGIVKSFRKEFKRYSKNEFRSLSKTPMIKDILSGMTKLNKDQIIDRVKEHLDEQ